MAFYVSIAWNQSQAIKRYVQGTTTILPKKTKAGVIDVLYSMVTTCRSSLAAGNQRIPAFENFGEF